MREDEHWEPLAPNCRVLVSRAHRFTTDTILLAHFAAPKKRERCADLGTGCGTIPLLWHARYAPREITGVELDADALRQARESVRENGLEDKIAVKCGDIREIRAVFPEPVLDLVACNPPYKAVGASGSQCSSSRMGFPPVCKIWSRAERPPRPSEAFRKQKRSCRESVAALF